MQRNIRKYLFLLPYIFLAIGLILLITGFLRWKNHATGTELRGKAYQERLPLSMFDAETFSPDSTWVNNNPLRFRNNFDAELFNDPPLENGPILRWWWPGAWVDSIQLVKELETFHEKGFGGVDIQPLAVGLDPDMEHWSQVHTYNSEGYFDLLKISLNKARQLGMSVDLSISALSPVGGPHVGLEEGLESLAFGEATILGDKVISLELPKPKLPYFYQWMAWEELFFEEENDQWATFRENKLELLEVFASKTLKEERSEYAVYLDDYVALDPDSILNISDFVQNGEIIWEAPKGYWKIIAVYKMPVAQSPWELAMDQKGYVLNPFKSSKVLANYNFLLGQKTGLPAYYANGMRGFSQAPFEYLAERMYTDEIQEYFEKQNGYKLTPNLPILLYPGKDNHLMKLQSAKRGPEYILGSADERIRKDYDKSLSDFFIQNYLDSSRVWAEKRGLISRIIPHGFDLDILKAAGHSSLPEAGQRYSGHGLLYTKMVSSGAELYARPWVSSLCLDAQGVTFSNSPSDIKNTADDLFLHGVNHLVFQGAPYQRIDAKYGKEAWMPFSSTYYPLEHNSEHLGADNSFWKFQKQLNDYFRRCQYLLRQGKTNAPILIYYPFLGFPAEQGSEYPNLQAPGLAKGGNEEAKWLENVKGLITALDELGLDWVWVNDESLQKARISRNKIRIGSNNYERLILIDVPEIEIKSLRNIEKLSTAGARIILLDNPPQDIKGYMNYEKHIAELDRLLIQLPKAIRLDSKEDIQNYFSGFPVDQKIAFARPYENLRATQRKSRNFEMIFLKNKAEKDRFYELSIELENEHNYIFNPWRGTIHKMEAGNQGIHRIFLNAQSTAFVLSAKDEIVEDSLLLGFNRLDAPLLGELSLSTRNIERWDFMLADENRNKSQMEFSDTTLFDWGSNQQLKFCSEEALYRTSFQLGDTLSNKQYILDLGELHGAVEVKVNTEWVGDCIIPPFRLDISEQISPGFNTIEIWLISSLKNRLVGRAREGDDRYEHYLQYESSLKINGLKGPVLIWEVDKKSELIN
ncbi:MAG: glycosyl hydrolase [Bacteroidota bacterium]